MVDEESKKDKKEEEKFEFDSMGEVAGYISLDEARVLAVRTAMETPGSYGRRFRGVQMVFEVVGENETEDHYVISLSFRPQDDFSGAPGQEQFFIVKEGAIAVRQVLSRPTPDEARRFPVVPVVIGLALIVVVAVAGAVIASRGEDAGGEAKVPVTSLPPDNTTAATPTISPEVPPSVAPPTTPATQPAIPVPTPVTPPIFLTTWGSNGTGKGQFKNPADIAFDPSGNLYITDTFNNRVQSFSANGTFLTTWGSGGADDGQFQSPHGIEVGPSGHVYVVDTVNHRIQVFSPEGTFLTKWGSKGSADGQFESPEWIAIDSTDNVYVSDRDNDRVQKFDSSGKFLTKWGSYGSGNGQFDSPKGIAFDLAGNVYVVDQKNHRV